MIVASDYENIDIGTDENGEFILKLTPEQYIKLADYISELESKNKKLEAKFKQALKELNKAYEKNKGFDLARLSDGLTGVGIATLIVLLAQGLR